MYSSLEEQVILAAGSRLILAVLVTQLLLVSVNRCLRHGCLAVTLSKWIGTTQQICTACLDVDVVVHAAGMNAEDTFLILLPLSILTVSQQPICGSCISWCGKVYLFINHPCHASPISGIINEDTAFKPHPYATSHYAGERALLHEAKQSKLTGVILRLSNAFGAPMHQDANCLSLLVNDLCKQMVQTRELVLNTSGQQFRDFIPLSKVCCATEWFVSGGKSDSQSKVYNICSNAPESILSMAKMSRIAVYVF